MMREKLIVALDLNDINKIKLLVDKLQDFVKYYKIGAIPFTYFGPEAVKFLKERGLKVMLDLKYHDIPNTVARACEGAMAMGVDLLTMHTSGGFMMMEEAVKAVSLVSDVKKIPRPKLLGITVLTSIDEAYFKDLFGDVERTLEEQVMFLARLAQSAGLDGVVASAHEIAKIRQTCGKDFLIITPGIRPEGEEIDDQARTMTAGQAIKAGADFIVVGRPIVAAKDPVLATKKIIKEIEDAG
ncbi:MAG: orotidine-5'-phosphate decarboxylase [bacterium]